MNNLSSKVSENRRMLLTITAIIIPVAIIALAVARIWASDSIETVTINWHESGHADFTSPAFTHWDDDPPLIPDNCAKCHSLHGILDFVGERDTPAGSVSEDMPIGTVVSCAACHNDSMHQIEEVEFPSGAVLIAMNDEAACLHCHQGTESTESVNEAIADLDDDTVDDELEFINPHYHVAAATMMGNTARVGYQYPGLLYVGRYEHTTGFQSCESCHDPHHLNVAPRTCSTCHFNVVEAADLRQIRTDPVDYDGDGNTTKGIADEIDTFHALLYDAIRLYAAEVIGEPILYSADNFPYFFVDVSNGGEVNPDDLTYGNRYTEWTPRLVRAAYNYQFVQKDPGAYSHNPHYALQLLYDSLRDLNEQVPVEMDRLLRPRGDNE